MAGGAEGGHAVAPAGAALAQLAAVDEVGEYTRSHYNIIFIILVLTSVSM